MSLPAVYIIETLVGLLRGMKRADTKSVELYLRTHEGFLIGVNRLNLRKLNPVICRDILEDLGEKYNIILFSHEEFHLFLPLRKLLSEICQAGLLYRDVNHEEAAIERRVKQMKINSYQAEQTEYVLSRIEIENLVDDDIQEEFIQEAFLIA